MLQRIIRVISEQEGREDRGFKREDNQRENELYLPLLLFVVLPPYIVLNCGCGHGCDCIAITVIAKNCEKKYG